MLISGDLRTVTFEKGVKNEISALYARLLPREGERGKSRRTPLTPYGKENFLYADEKAGDGLISFYTPYRFPEEAEPLCEDIHRRSFLSDLYRYRKRAGLALGFILAAALIFVSTLFVWDIRIVGAENTEEEEIFAALERRGFRIGAYIPSLDKERIAMEITKDDGRFSWFKINMRGTVATIDIHERTGRDGIEALTPPSNLIASCDAQIELLDVSGGATVVKTGQTVKKASFLSAES